MEGWSDPTLLNANEVKISSAISLRMGDEYYLIPSSDYVEHSLYSIRNNEIFSGIKSHKA